MTAYSSGLRVSELVRLQPSDIDSQREIILIKQGKGNKDRYTILSNSLLLKLRQYWKTYRPKKWLFPSRNQENHICERGAAYIYHLSKKKAGITKKGGIHTLRHCFAIHLLENNVDIRTIQQLLGHSSLSTTAKYLKISNKHIKAIQSPLDILPDFLGKEG